VLQELCGIIGNKKPLTRRGSLLKNRMEGKAGKI
jgi:hypothetical protein